jgi:hypothetical protein
VELSWAWLSRAARCSSELYGGIVTACAVDDSVASPFTAAEVTVNLLVNGKATRGLHSSTPQLNPSQF